MSKFSYFRLCEAKIYLPALPYVKSKIHPIVRIENKPTRLISTINGCKPVHSFLVMLLNLVIYLDVVE